jgi:hypothetical protein
VRSPSQEPFNSGILRANSINPSIKTETPEATVQQLMTGVVVGADNRRINEETGMGKGR